MKIFQALILIFRTEGIFWPQKYKNHPFNIKNMSIIFTLGIYTILSALFLLLEAKTFSEYGDSFYSTVTTLFCLVIFSLVVWKSAKIFDLIDGLEAIILKREQI